MLNWELSVNNAENSLHASNYNVVKDVMLFNHFLQNVRKFVVLQFYLQVQ